MSWQPLRPGAFLRLFALSLGLIVVCLVGFLFLVELEAVVPASGIVMARDAEEVRVVFAGLVEAGWYEGVVPRPDGEAVAVRLDAHGDGQSDPARGAVFPVQQYQLLEDGRRLPVLRESLRFHVLKPGDELWPGQVLAAMRTEELRFKLGQAEERLRHAESQGTGSVEFDQARAERDWLRYQLSQAVWHVPRRGQLWQVVEVRVASGQAVQPGDVVAVFVPLDPRTRQPRDLQVRLELDEDRCGDVVPGQVVHLDSAVHNHRIHGRAAAVVERLEPSGEPGPGGKRRFHAVAAVTEAPFSLPLGSSCQAEVVVGRKRVFRIILEH